MPLCTLEQVKRKLQIPASDPLDDAALAPVRDAAEVYMLAATGYVLADTLQTERLQPAPRGQPIRLLRRPVANVTAQARMAGSTAWTPVAVDVLDADQGIIVLPVIDPLPLTQAGTSAPWYLWHLRQWDLVEISYTAQALAAVPADLSDATATLAAWWYQLQLAGPATTSETGPIRATYDPNPIPPVVAATLARYRAGGSRWV